MDLTRPLLCCIAFTSTASQPLGRSPSSPSPSPPVPLLPTGRGLVKSQVARSHRVAVPILSSASSRRRRGLHEVASCSKGRSAPFSRHENRRFSHPGHPRRRQMTDSKAWYNQGVGTNVEYACFLSSPPKSFTPFLFFPAVSTGLHDRTFQIRQSARRRTAQDSLPSPLDPSFAWS